MLVHYSICCFLFVRLVCTLEVALFPSTGCYSHDVMMKQIGEGFEEEHNMTWIQTYLYDFGFGEMKLRQEWNRINIFGHDSEGVGIMQRAGSLLWQQNVPTDFERPWDLKGTLIFFRMLERHQIFCEKMLTHDRFKQYVESQKTDLVILDHFLQECMGGLSHLLNSSVVQFSNWPIADGYITSLNVPANPSSVPKTGTPFTGLGMSFGERVGNTLFHNLIIITRYIQIYVLDCLFARNGYPQVSIITSEAERILYAGRSEFLFEVVRPINNRVKHFGGANCRSPRDYVIRLPSEIEPAGDNKNHVPSPVKSIHSNDTLLIEETCGESSRESHLSHIQYRSSIYSGLSSEVVEKRRNQTENSFPNIDWKRIDARSFILVSFGSVAQVEKMPLDRLQLLMKTFSAVSHTVIWQTNSQMPPVLEKYNITTPDNMILVDWAPIKELLAHPNLQYIICHGGINTINELLLFGVPVIGVPLQGDQGSNLRRLVDLGGALIVSTVQMAEGKLLPAIMLMQQNLLRFWQRSSNFAAMLKSYRDLHSNDQQFWISWTARHGEKLKKRRLMKFRYTGDEENLFYLEIASVLLLALLALLQ